jgi:histidinol-phosphate aminotransferase
MYLIWLAKATGKLVNIKTLAKENITSILPYQGGKPIDELKREMGLKNIVKMASNESPFSPSTSVLKALKAELLRLNRYPDGNCYYLRQELSKKLKISQKSLTLANGSDEIVVLTLMGFLKESEEVIIAEPTFLVYKIASSVQEATIRFVPLKNYRYDLDGMLDAITDKTKIIFIANPDNPTGSYVTEKELGKFLKNVPKNVIVVLDEAYREFVSTEDYPFKTIDMIGSHPIIIMRTFSKIYALAGLRVGYAISNPSIADILNRVREPFNVNSLAQVGAVAALKEKRYIDEIKKIILEQKNYLYRELKRLNVQFVESQTNFILLLFNFPGIKLYEFLLEKGIIVRDMSGWGLKNCIRVTIGLPKENRLFIKYLEEFLRKQN